MRRNDRRALVLTSSRAAIALERAIVGNSNDEEKRIIADVWSQKKVFVVGKKTSVRFKRAWKRCFGERSVVPVTIGEDSGSAANLCRDHLVPFMNNLPPDSDNSSIVLFICGNKRRSVVPDALGKALKEVVVYETVPSPPLKKDLDLEEYEAMSEKWVVFFSPSGVMCARSDSMLSSFVENASIACIGPTSSDAVIRSAWSCEAVASSPEPTALVDAIERFMGQFGRTTRVPCRIFVVFGMMALATRVLAVSRSVV